jgi:hypothetical protein
MAFFVLQGAEFSQQVVTKKYLVRAAADMHAFFALSAIEEKK